MLVIERPIGTAVLIGDDIQVEISSVRNRRYVRLAIEAPKDTPILREELTCSPLLQFSEQPVRTMPHIV